MWGAVIGDIAGSRFEGSRGGPKDFELFHRLCTYTDDTVCMAAIADIILNDRKPDVTLQRWCRRHPGRGYGGFFREWIGSAVPTSYGSFGNGAAMRVSPVALLHRRQPLEDALEASDRVTAITHDHPEGIKGARAVTEAIWLALREEGPETVRREITARYGYELERCVDDMRPSHRFDVTCQGTVPTALVCAFESTSLEDAGRNAVSLGGDADTLQPHVTVGGLTVTGEPAALPDPEEDDTHAWTLETALEEEAQTVTADDLRHASSFYLSSADPDDPLATAFTTWGRTALGAFEAEVNGVRMDGDVSTVVIGGDVTAAATTAGVMISQSSGEGRWDPIDGESGGTMRSDIAGVYPYGQIALGGSVAVWASAGAGQGTIAMRSDELERTMETDLSMRFAALGARGRVLDGTGPSKITLDVKSDAMWVHSESARSDDLIATEGDVTRVRLTLSGQRPIDLEQAGTLVPNAEIGLRHDAGDAETGTGVEIGAGLRYSVARLQIEAQARMLAAHEDDGYEEWGASAGLVYTTRENGTGLNLSLRPLWGQAQSATETLWGATHGGELAARQSFEAEQRIEAEAGYTMRLRNNKGLLTPYTGLAVQGSPSGLTGGAECAGRSQTRSPSGSKRRRSETPKAKAAQQRPCGPRSDSDPAEGERLYRVAAAHRPLLACPGPG